MISIEEWQLLSFFEKEPVLMDPEDIPWHYNTALYSIKNRNLELSCSISPSYKDVRIMLILSDVTIYEIDMIDVKDVKYLQDKKAEKILIQIDDNNELFIQLKPQINLTHKVLNKDQ